MKRARKEIERSSLMNVGRRVDYAVRALSYLAAQPSDKIVGKAEIETRQDIPSHYLSKIMKDLVAGGLVQSHIGRNGGFNLARGPKTISIKEVYETVERPLALMECLEKGEEYCRYCSVCNQISIWAKAQGLVADYLASVTIGDIADEMGLKARLVRAHG